MLNITKDLQDKKLVIGLEGKLDTITAPDFEKAVKENIEGV